MSSQFSLRTRRNAFGQHRGLFTGFDHWLSGAVIGLLGLGIALVYSSTRQWFASNGLDPQYYLKRHIINIIIIVKMIVNGSLNSNSNTDKNECCISKTSVPVLAKMSPFLFSEKKEMGRFTVFL